MLVNILITGGAGDIAKYCQQKLIHDGFFVDAPTHKSLNVTSIQSVDDFFEHKKYDVVINLAGTLYSALIEDSIPELWIRDIEVNLIGTYLVTRKAIINNFGVKIINMASTASFNSYKDWTSYCASKAGVLKLTEGLYKDQKNVILLCPGAIDTKLRDNLKIRNDNVMSIKEGSQPILNAVFGKYKSGSLVFYRKDQINVTCLSEMISR